MDSKQIFDLVESYGRQYPEVERILKILDGAEQYLIQIDQLEQLERLILTETSNTNKGLYESSGR